jgi:hypothetical protein
MKDKRRYTCHKCGWSGLDRNVSRAVSGKKYCPDCDAPVYTKVPEAGSLDDVMITSKYRRA